MIKAELKVYLNADTLYVGVAEFFVQLAQKTIQQAGRFTVVLSGGNTPKPIYKLLSTPQYSRLIPWDKVYVFWTDERYVPPDSPESNLRMAREALLDSVPIPPEHVYPIPFLSSPQASAQAYEANLHTFFVHQLPRFDLIFLGLGEDGHTASLFPATSVLNENQRWVGQVFVPKLNMNRITLMPTLINQAANIAFLVVGDKKAQAVYQTLQGPQNLHEIPAQLIQPATGNLTWFLDRSAAHLLK